MIEYKGCQYCLHLRPDGTCLAFDPDIIPIFIASGQLKHIKPLPIQRNNVVYKPSEHNLYKRFRIKHERQKE